MTITPTQLRNLTDFTNQREAEQKQLANKKRDQERLDLSTKLYEMILADWQREAKDAAARGIDHVSICINCVHERQGACALTFDDQKKLIDHFEAMGFAAKITESKYDGDIDYPATCHFYLELKW
jgi:hypothetical protein